MHASTTFNPTPLPAITSRWLVLALVMMSAPAALIDGAESLFVPDYKIKPDDYTVLMCADGHNPHNLHAWINDHRRMQVKDWPLGGETTWEVEVVEGGDYAVNVLFAHQPHLPLTVRVSAGTNHCEALSSYVANREWRRLPLAGTLHLNQGRQTIALGIAPEQGASAETIEVLSIELVLPTVKDRLHQAAVQLREHTNSTWFRDARYGLMCHWTAEIAPRSGPPKPYAQAVAEFHVEGFADQVADSGAKFITMTTSHALMYFPAPLTSLQRILPGRTAQRDLIAEIATALGKRGIRLMLYYHLGSDSDPEWLKACGFSKTDTSEFWNNWVAVIGEIGQRYGDKLAGWWFDDGTANYYYRSAPWQRLATAAKLGNPDRLISFNPWILPTPTEFEDYYGGEGNDDASVQGWLKPGDHGIISGGEYQGLQASAALIMEDDWLHKNRDTAISAPGRTPQEVAALLRRFIALENVPMFNLQIYQEGTFSPDTIAVLHQAHELLAAPPGK